jgi:heme-degrading monooxygenase HmoA
MIARIWTAQATPGNAPLYARFFEGFATGDMTRMKGFKRAELMQRREPGSKVVEITVITYWESMDAIRVFAGKPIDRARVEPEARPLLSRSGRRVKHFEVQVFE